MTWDQTLIASAKRGDRKAAEQALLRGADPNAIDDGWSPLLWAAQQGHTDIANLLLDAGANPNFSDAGGVTPLKQAVDEMRLDTLECLLLRGADVNHRCASDDGCTVLHSAAAYGRCESIRLLLLYGANLKMLNDSGKTPHDIAVHCGELEAAVLLR